MRNSLRRAYSASMPSTAGRASSGLVSAARAACCVIEQTFVALALTLGLSAVLPQLPVAVAVLSAALSWPAIVPRYAHGDAWRLLRIPWREALRIRPEESYLERRLEHYGVDRLIEQKTAPGSTVFTFVPIPEAYTSRHIRVEYQSASNQIAGKILWTATQPEYAPTWRLKFRFPRQTLRGLRVVETKPRRRAGSS